MTSAASYVIYSVAVSLIKTLGVSVQHCKSVIVS